MRMRTVVASEGIEVGSTGIGSMVETTGIAATGSTAETTETVGTATVIH